MTIIKDRPPADFRYAKLKDKEKKTAAELEACKKGIEMTTDLYEKKEAALDEINTDWQ